MQRNTRTNRTLAPWLIGVFLASLLFALLYAFSSFQYIGSDDAPILRSFMGYEGGEPATFSMILHTALAWPLFALAKLFPGVAWFSIVQLCLLWLAQVVIVKSLSQLAARRGLPLWAGALAGALFLAGYAVYVTCRVSFTTTSALVGAAAVAQLATVNFQAEKRGAVFLPMLGSTALLLQCYFLRQISVLPPLCFWALMLAAKLAIAFGGGRTPLALAKPALAATLATALLFGGFAALREAEIRLTGTRPMLDWQLERSALMDYTDFDATTRPETREAIGWSEPEFTLFTYWYFLDDNISTQALQTLNRQQMEDDAALTVADRLNATAVIVRNSLLANPAIAYGFLAALAMAAAAMLAMGRLRRLSAMAVLALLCAAAGALLLMVYLGYSGRLPMRAAASVLYPFAAFAFTALAGALDKPPHRVAAPAPTIAPATAAQDGGAADLPAMDAKQTPAHAAHSAPAQAVDAEQTPAYTAHSAPALAGDAAQTPAYAAQNAPAASSSGIGSTLANTPPAPGAAPNAANGRTSAALRVAAMPPPDTHGPQEPPAKPNRPRRQSARLGMALLAALVATGFWFATQAAITMAKAVQPPVSEETMDYSSVNIADLDAYALENPDTLFIHDLSQFGDTRLFPATPSQGLAGNVMFWGGYPVHTPSWQHMLAKYGITKLDGTVFLRDNVLLASTDPEPWPSLMAYIAQCAGTENLEWEYDTSIGYVNLFRIYTY